MDKNKYNCQMAVDHLLAEINQHHDLQEILEEIIHTYPDCESILRETASTWNELEQIDVPQPSQSMHNNFYKALKNYEVPPSNINKLDNQRNGFTLNLMQIAAALILLVCGIFIGRFMTPQADQAQLAKMEPVSNEHSEMIFAGTSAINRLDKVQNVKSIENPDKIVFEALNQVLINDQNINVRLSAIEAMLHFAEYSDVRKYLIQAIPLQESAIIQIALADAMRELQEKNSLDNIRQLIESGDLDLEVKDYYEKTINEIM